MERKKGIPKRMPGISLISPYVGIIQIRFMGRNEEVSSQPTSVSSPLFYGESVRSPVFFADALPADMGYYSIPSQGYKKKSKDRVGTWGGTYWALAGPQSPGQDLPAPGPAREIFSLSLFISYNSPIPTIHAHNPFRPGAKVCRTKKEVTTMIRIAIVEDDRDFAQLLIEYLSRYEKERMVDIQPRYFRDGEDIVTEYTEDFDLILLDIQMPFLSGMEAARAIRKRDEDVLILFLTGNAQFSIEGYEVRAFDYLLKPITYETFAARLDLAIGHRRSRKGKYLLVTVADGVRKIEAGSILYIESQGHVMHIHTRQGVLETHARIGDLEEQLPTDTFFRCHKGYLVNMLHVDGVLDADCLVDGHRLPISRRKKKEFLDFLTRII